MYDIIARFRDAMASAGIPPPDVIEADGRLRRFCTNGKPHDDAGWYVLYGDDIPAGSFGDWRTGVSETWRANISRALTPAEELAHRARVATLQRQREAEEACRRELAKARAAAIWEAATPDADDHPYLVRKGVKAHGLRVYRERLVIPMRADGELHSLQFIGPDGDKRFLAGGRAKGCYFGIGSPKGAAKLCIAEGYATVATIHEATGYPVAMAFNAGNLESVAKAMRHRYPDLPLILCADDDTRTEGNPGLTMARRAARSVGGLLAVPDFGRNPA